MHNLGEEIVGAYLQHVKRCEFVQYNLQTPDIQGEIDVIGINIRERVLYVCEVAIHLVTGLQYVKDKRPDNVARLGVKFGKDIEYARKYFPDYEHRFMLWTPIVKETANTQYNQMAHVTAVRDALRDHFQVELELVINEHFLECLTQLREFARTETKEMKSPIMRLLQIEEALKAHVGRRAGKHNNA